MLRSYFKTAWRSLLKNRFYSLLNILGLAVGLCFAFFTVVYIWTEEQVNQSLLHPQQLYILESQWKEPGMGSEFKTIAPLAKALHQQYPNLVSNYYRWDWVSTIVSHNNAYFRDSIQIGDTTLVSMFGFPLLYGDRHHLFSQEDAVVITEAKALKYFGTADAIGKTLTIENYSGEHKDFMVTGVLQDLPQNSVTTSSVPVNTTINSTFIPLQSLSFFYKGADTEDWSSTNFTSYIALQKGVSVPQISAAIHQLRNANADDFLNANLQINPAPLATYHLDNNNGAIRKMIWTLSFIAGFILLIAILNFVNISIGSSSARLKEIGVRKVLGGRKRQLMIQFLSESFLLVLFAVMLAVSSVPLVKPFFEGAVGVMLPSFVQLPLYFLWLPLVAVVIIGLVAGAYPAWILSSLGSVDSLKKKAHSVHENLFIKRLFIGIQFVIAIIVFVSAIVVTQQVRYSMNTDLGYNKDQVVNIALPRNWTAAGVSKMRAIRDKLREQPGVADVSLCYSIPNRNTINNNNLYRADKDSTQSIPVFTFISDERYPSTFQIPLVAGHFFTAKDGQLNTPNIVINETAARVFGYSSPQAAVGNNLVSLNDDEYTICGVVKDYHFESKQESIKPLMFMHIEGLNAYRFLSFRLQPGSMQVTIARIQSQWKSLLPDVPFDYWFMDETVQKAYLNEIHLEKATYMATTVAVILVLLGIVGIVSQNTSRRVKEIGIRKVLGASAMQIITLFIGDFVSVIVMSTLIAVPLSYLITNNWLHNYAYRISMNPLVPVCVVVTLVVLTFALIFVQTLRSAVANPVDSLRNE